MPKWADLCVIAVSYNLNRKHLMRVLVRPDNGDTLGPPRFLSRQSVLSEIERGVRVISAPLSRRQPGAFEKGARVRVVRVGREKYLTTRRNPTKRDNLGRLPELG